jgi:putative phosphoesterase
MRLALLSDVHGNPIALDAVLADIDAQGGVEAFWVLGDLAALGYDPIGALERIKSLPNVHVARGNTDHYLVTGERPGPTPQAVPATGWLDWLSALPIELRLTLPNGVRLLGAHASPGQCDGKGIRPVMSDGEIGQLIEGCGADLVCAGHTHFPFERRVNGVHVVNLGSVSNPLAPDLRASYVMLEADANSYRVWHRRVEYDRQAVIAAVERVRLLGAAHVLAYLTGQTWPVWNK